MDIIIENSLKNRAVAYVERYTKSLNIAPHIILVVDSNTYKALGEQLYNELRAHYVCVNLHMLEGNISADMQHAQEMQRSIRPDTFLIAAGSGTINDICKYAAYLSDIPYIIFPTAPSMNGYASANASLTCEGIKSTLSACAPRAILCDLQVLAAAPLPMIKAGLGDSLCRPTAQADWLLSHLLLGTYYDPTPFIWLAEYEDELFSHSNRLIARDRSVIKLLIETLIASGKGMAFCGGSYPASQGEHMIAHTMQMLYDTKLPSRLHGEEIGVTTLAMAGLQHQLLTTPPVITASFPAPSEFQRLFGNARGESLHMLYQKKQLNMQQAESVNDTIQTHWNQWQEQLHDVMIDTKTLESVLHHASAPTTAQDLSWSASHFERAFNHAYMIRGRFTFLDIAAMGGVCN